MQIILMASTTRKVAEGTMIFFTRKIWISLFSGISTIIIIRALGVYHYGILTLALSIVGILAPFLDFDLGTIISVDMANELGKNNLSRVKRYIKDYAKLEIILGLVFCLVLVLFIGYINDKYGNEISSVVKITIILLFIQAIKNILATVFYGFSNFRYFTLIDVIESLVKFVLVLIIFFFSQFNLIKVSLIILISSIIPLFVTIPLFLKFIKPLRAVAISPEPLLKETIFKHGKFHIINQPIKTALESFRLWIIKFFVGVEGVAIFQVANKIFGYLNILFGSVEGVLMPILSQAISQNIQLAREMVKKSIKYLTYLGIIIMIGSFVLIGPLLNFFFENKYNDSLPVLYWLFVTFPMAGFNVIVRPLFYSFKGQKYLLNTYLIATLLIGYPLGVVLTYFYGVIGFAFPVGAYLTVFLRYYYIKKLDAEFYFKVRDFFRFDNYDKLLINKVLKKLKLIK